MRVKVLQLTCDLGMPSGSTGNDIVLRITPVKGEPHSVTPLVEALAAAARVLEDRIVSPTTLLQYSLVVLSAVGGREMSS